MGRFKKVSLAYWAGFFDGEGCIVISSQGHKYAGKTNKHYRLELALGSTNNWIIELMKFQFGGAVYCDRRDNHPATHRPFWRWMICGKQAQSFLEEMLPYLYIKRAEAEIAIKWQQNRAKGIRTKEVREKEDAITEAQRIVLSQLKREV